MKKAKFVTLFAALLAMGITACGGSGNPSEAPSEEPVSSEAPSSSKASSSKSSAKSSEKSSAPVSSEKQPEPEPEPVPHDLEAFAHEKGEGEVTEVIQKCKEDDYYEIAFDAFDAAATLSVSGDRKSNYVKLSKQGDGASSIEFKIWSPAATTGRFWIDITGNTSNFWSRDTKDGAQSLFYTYNDTTTNINTWKNKVELNGAEVNFADAKFKVKGVEIPFAELVYDDFGTLASSSGETICVPMPEVSLVEGVNTLKFTRLTGYAFNMHKFTFKSSLEHKVETALDDKGFPVVLQRTWVEGEPVKNSEGKDCIPLTAGNKAGVKIKMTDTSAESASFSSGKLPTTAGQGAVYHVKAPKAGNYQLVLRGKVSASGDSYPFNDPDNSDRGVVCKLNDVEQDVFGLRMYSDAGLDHDEFREFVLAQPLALRGPEQEDKIYFENPYYRIVFDMDSYLLLQEI